MYQFNIDKVYIDDLNFVDVVRNHGREERIDLQRDL